MPNFASKLKCNNVYEFYAYGYDESNDDYEVFRILCGRAYYRTEGCQDLYSQNTNSWRRIEDLNLGFIRGFHYIRDQLHWIMVRGEKMGTLDLESETYGEVEQTRYEDEDLMYCDLKGL
ncbi:hypothetical protein ACH5RR_031942 [Cinchona calisaya]|uniref:Uncharacterized protein n=1 Tax=Cinchona calisaya TaxID=153742 RepID=A0ABD2YKX8_9GENT